MLGLAIGELVIAFVLAWFASAILRGSQGIRTAVGVVIAFRGPVAVLQDHAPVRWALFVNEQSDEWFGTDA